MSITRLPPSGPYSIPRAKSRPVDETREQRLARHLAWCDALHRDRVAAAADLGAPRVLPPRLRLVAPVRAASQQAGRSRLPRGLLRHEGAFFATVLASLACTFVCASLSTPPLISDVVAVSGSITDSVILR